MVPSRAIGALCQGARCLLFSAPFIRQRWLLICVALPQVLKLCLRMLLCQKQKVPPAWRNCRLQPVQRDFAFIIDEDVTAEALLRAIRGAGKPLLADAAVFDVYAGRD